MFLLIAEGHRVLQNCPDGVGDIQGERRCFLHHCDNVIVARTAYTVDLILGSAQSHVELDVLNAALHKIQHRNIGSLALFFSYGQVLGTNLGVVAFDLCKNGNGGICNCIILVHHRQIICYVLKVILVHHRQIIVFNLCIERSAQSHV